MNRIVCLLFAWSLSGTHYCLAQEAAPGKGFTHADTLRGSIGPERAWWNVIHYTIQIAPDFEKKFISGETAIRFEVLHPGKTMQIDLQEPLRIKAIGWRKGALKYTREGSAFHVRFPRELPKGSKETVFIAYEGNPRVAVRPPWDGGWIFAKDKLGRPWMSVACQGLGASVWYPCKDHQSDEPDSGATLSVVVPDSLVAVGNGRLTSKEHMGDVYPGFTTYTWKVVNPINNYDIIPYIGKYVNWQEEYAGEKGKLDCNFWVLDYNLDKAKTQFKQADSMLHCFEYWMGPYPFYEDGYKLVEAPHLGMEHQSDVAYGNHFGNGYLGRDLSGSGWGLKWDFIIVHESGHEWFGNNITTNDLADMWVHEGFTNYSETLYTTCQYGEEAGNDYCIGTRRNIRNDKPIIAHYGVNEEGSADMYYKGGNMLHMIRQILGDSAYRGLLRGLNAQFYHQTVDSRQVEEYISRYAHKDLSKIFDQYLRSTQIPVLEYKPDGKGGLSYRWTNCVKGFDMPLKVFAGGLPEQWVYPTEDWKDLSPVIDGGPGSGSTEANQVGDGTFSVDRNFYVRVKKGN